MAFLFVWCPASPRCGEMILEKQNGADPTAPSETLGRKQIGHQGCYNASGMVFASLSYLLTHSRGGGCGKGLRIAKNSDSWISLLGVISKLVVKPRHDVSFGGLQRKRDLRSFNQECKEQQLVTALCQPRPMETGAPLRCAEQPCTLAASFHCPGLLYVTTGLPWKIFFFWGWFHLFKQGH